MPLQRPVSQLCVVGSTCDVPPNNAPALTVAQLDPSDPTNLPSVSGTVVTSPTSSNHPQNVLQRRSKACWSAADPAPTGGCRLRGVFTSDAEVSRSFTAAEAAWRAAAGASGGRPVATAAAGDGKEKALTLVSGILDSFRGPDRVPRNETDHLGWFSWVVIPSYPAEGWCKCLRGRH